MDGNWGVNESGSCGYSSRRRRTRKWGEGREKVLLSTREKKARRMEKMKALLREHRNRKALQSSMRIL